jgi:predicted Zn-dependent peptidase
MYEDAPDEIIHDIFTQSLFQSSPIGYPILGSREIIGNLPRQEILKYYKKMYTAPNIVVSMSGNFKTDTIIQEVGELFGDIRSGKGEIINKYRPDATYSTIIRQKDIEQVHLITGTMASPEIDIDRYKISLLSTILGGGMSSRLFQKIREERGLAYSVFSYTNRFRHAGLFAVYAGCAEAEAPYVLELILQELQELRENIVPSRELDRAKEQMKGGIILGLESTNARMNRLGRNEIYFHKQIPIDEILQKISNVTPEDIQEMAQRYFYQERLAMTVIGPSDDQEPFLEKLNILENE